MRRYELNIEVKGRNQDLEKVMNAMRPLRKELEERFKGEFAGFGLFLTFSGFIFRYMRFQFSTGYRVYKARKFAVEFLERMGLSRKEGVFIYNPTMIGSPGYWNSIGKSRNNVENIGNSVENTEKSRPNLKIVK